jgi:hypothetical protein
MERMFANINQMAKNPKKFQENLIESHEKINNTENEVI